MSHRKPSIDLERGPKVGPATPPLPFFRRRKSLLCLFVLVLLCVAALFHGALPAAATNFGVRFIKDSMRPQGAAPSDSPASFDALAAAAAPGSPSAALRPLGEQMSVGSPPTPQEKVLLFLELLKSPDFRVGKNWQETLLPDTEAELLAQFAHLKNATGEVQLFKEDRQRWNRQHQGANPITVFSKSYCPYSKKAKHLLDSFNAKYTAYEVDLRADHANLQPLLAALSKHETFPTIFFRDQLIGGSDDLQSLQDLGLLHGALRGNGAIPL